MSTLHIYCETGAIGDTALNLCRTHIAMEDQGHAEAIVHTSPIFRFGEPMMEKPYNPDVITILKNCPFIKDVVFDCNYNDLTTFKFSQKYNCPIQQPMTYRERHNIKDWVNLESFFPPDAPMEGKIAVFQPISLRYKPQKHLEDYIPEWNRCIKTLCQHGYKVVMVGGIDDPIHLTMNKFIIEKTINKIGSWTQLQSLAYLLYRANIVVGCDSWAAIWGIAARIPSAVAWGYRMEAQIDWWVTGFLGNRDCYKYAWSSQKDYCDVALANYLGNLDIKEQNV